MSLRKRLNRARLVSVEQVGFERILKLSFKNHEESFNLYIELFTNGNVVLTDLHDEIVVVKSSETFKDRSLKRGINYTLPPAKLDTSKIGLKEFTKVLRSGARSTVLKILAIELGLGGKYATELCNLSGIKSSLEKATEDEAKIIYSELKQLLEKEIAPNIGLDANPFILTTDPPAKSFDSFSEAIRHSVEVLTPKEKSKDMKKYETMLQKQKETLIETENKIESLEEKANMVFARMQEVQEVITSINENGWGVKHPILKETRPERREIVVEL